MKSGEAEEFPRNEAVTAAKQCFTKVQECQLWGIPVGSCIRLCPSMDLIAYQQHQGTLSTVLNIHRTLNWQKIAAVSSSSQISSQDRMKNEFPSQIVASNESSLADDCDFASQIIEWRPDGRFVAVAVGGTIHIYSVDGLLLAMTSEDDSLRKDIDSHDTDSEAIIGSFTLELIHGCCLESEKRNFITSVSWAHIGTWSEHRHWPSNTSNVNAFLEQQYYHKMYADRWTYVLPPSEYHVQSNSLGDTYGFHELEQYRQSVGDRTDIATGMIGVGFQSYLEPLSVLCVTTKTDRLHLFLNGRYQIASNISLSTPLSSTSTVWQPIVVSPDLTHFITAPVANSASSQQNFSTVSVLSLSILSRHRKFYHSFAVLYCRIVHHMDGIRKAIPEIYATWKTSLKPIDLKMDGLFKLMQKYGLVSACSTEHGDDESNRNESPDNPNSLGSLLVHYIVSGNTPFVPTLSNAIEHFFTGVQMNDQLVQRMGQTLLSAVANIESTVTKLLVAPATALVHEIDQLYGLSAYRTDLFLTGDIVKLRHSAQQLFAVAGGALSSLVEARSRLRDFLAWLRYTGAKIKASGTAVGSVQRENVKKRRISDSVVRKLLLHLQEQKGDLMISRAGITETLLNLRFSLKLRASIEDPTDELSNMKHQDERNLLHVLEMTLNIANHVFEYPRSFVTRSMQRTDICLPRHVSITENCHHLAITTRLGQGGIDPSQSTYCDDKPDGFFTPNDMSGAFKCSSQDITTSNVRQWLVVAEAVQTNEIRLRAFALTWTSIADDVFDGDFDMFDGLESESEWTVSLSLPLEYRIREIVFFGDNGKSSLVSAGDVGSKIGGKEGQHRLGLLVSKPNHHNDNCSNAESVELWVVQYDDLNFIHQALKTVEHVERTNYAAFLCSSHASMVKNRYRYLVVPHFSSSSGMDSEKFVFARSRMVFPSVVVSDDDKKHGGFQTCRLFLSGSRDIGAISCKQQASVLLHILDLAEDEEEDGFADGVDDNDAMER